MRDTGMGGETSPEKRIFSNNDSPICSLPQKRLQKRFSIDCTSSRHRHVSFTNSVQSQTTSLTLFSSETPMDCRSWRTSFRSRQNDSANTLVTARTSTRPTIANVDNTRKKKKTAGIANSNTKWLSSRRVALYLTLAFFALLSSSRVTRGQGEDDVDVDGAPTGGADGSSDSKSGENTASPTPGDDGGGNEVSGSKVVASLAGGDLNLTCPFLDKVYSGEYEATWIVMWEKTPIKTEMGKQEMNIGDWRVYSVSSDESSRIFNGFPFPVVLLFRQDRRGSPNNFTWRFIGALNAHGRCSTTV